MKTGTTKGSEMGNIATLITAATERVSGLGQGLLKEVETGSAAKMPKGIHCNHPVFVYGHLSIYPQMIMSMLGQEAGNTAVPSNYNDLFMHGVECQDDQDGSIYPPLAEVVEHFTRANSALIEFVKSVDDETLLKEIEGNDGFKDAFGTNGAMVMFLLHDHPMFHYGQVSTWRRAMGLGSVM